MNNCSGRASYNTAYEHTPMRTPLSKMKGKKIFINLFFCFYEFNAQKNRV